MNLKIPIFIVNLAKDTDRKAHMLQLCEKYSLNCQFIEAVYGKELSPSYIESVYDKDKAIKGLGRELGVGEIGCALSHIEIYKKIINENLPYAIILEDDIDILHDLQKITDIYKNIPADLELLLLGEYCNTISFDTQFSSFWKWHTIGNGFRAVRLTELTFGCHGYLLTYNGAKKLLNQLHKIVKPLDYYTGSEKNINLYAMRPVMVIPNTAYSLQSNLTDERVSIEAQKQSIVYNEKWLMAILQRIGVYRPLRLLYYRLKIPKKYKIS